MTLHISRFLQGSYPNSDVERLQTQCFKSVWVATALHQVRKMQREMIYDWSEFCIKLSNHRV